MTMTDEVPHNSDHTPASHTGGSKSAIASDGPDLNRGLKIIRDMAKRLDLSPGVYGCWEHDGQVFMSAKPRH